MLRIAWLAVAFVLWVGIEPLLAAQNVAAASAPSEEELNRLLAAEPLGAKTWSAWRERYLGWRNARTKRSRESTDKLAQFVFSQLSDGKLPDYLQADAIAWYFCAREVTRDAKDPVQASALAEEMSRRAIELDPKFSEGHESLALTLIERAVREENRRDALLAAAQISISDAQTAEPDARLDYLRGFLRFASEDFISAESFFLQATKDFPESESIAMLFAQAILGQTEHSPTWSEAIAPLLKQFPEEPDLLVMHALGLVREGKYSAAIQELHQARERGAEVDRIVPPDLLKRFEEMAKVESPEFTAALRELEEGEYIFAEASFRSLLDGNPDNIVLVRGLARALTAQSDSQIRKGRQVDALAARFPDDGELQAVAGISLANRERYAEADAAFARAKSLGYDPAQLIGQKDVDDIHELAKPGVIKRTLQGVALFVVVYALIMGGMVLGGWILSYFNREAPRVTLAVANGRVAFSESESWSTRCYVFILTFGLVMFYVAIPFVFIGGLGMTAALLYGVMMLPRVPIQLLLIILGAGIAICWGAVKALFVRPRAGSFGVLKTPAQLPRLHAAIHEVAAKVGTEPTDEVFIAPGSEIGVHQEGRGPFGAFGVKRRVLTLGLSSLQLLSVSELKAILAHEYAHFSHADTARGRYIHQVSISIEEALNFMGSQLGRWNYVNPFFWFFFWYYRAYNMLAAGFSRTREYLADRMAVAQYGKSAFLGGLKKVATDGQLFEATAHANIRQLLTKGQAFENVYDAFRKFRDQDFSAEDREKLEKGLYEEQSSQFATHPTFLQRSAAVAEFPDLPQSESEPALSLVDDVPKLEKELTDYLTSYHSMVFELMQQQAQAG